MTLQIDIPRKLVVIDWIDSCSLSGAHTWKRVDELEARPNRCRSVGWVMAETADGLTLASSLSEHQCSGDITIPKVAIVKRRTLK